MAGHSPRLAGQLWQKDRKILPSGEPIYWMNPITLAAAREKYQNLDFESQPDAPSFDLPDSTDLKECLKTEALMSKLQSPDKWGNKLPGLFALREKLNPPNTRRYYFKMELKHYKKFFQRAPAALEIYISVSLLARLSSPVDSPQGCANTAADIMWLATNANWDTPTQPVDWANTSVPVRRKNGQVIIVKLKLENGDIPRASWQKWCKETLSPAQAGRSWHARSTKFPLKHPLLIFPADISDETFVSDGALALCVLEVEEENVRKKRPWHVQMAGEDPIEDKNYMRLSLDPFGLFLTYIHVEDWDEWMKYVGSMVPNKPKSIRPFVTESKKVLTDCWVKLAAESAFVIAELQKKSTWDIIGKVMKECDAGAQEKLSGISQQERSLAKRVLRHMYAINRVSYTDGGIGLLVYLEARKLFLAQGKRAGEPDQKKVMGGISAPEIARGCGWHEQMPIALTNAEWLHLSGFAYGGFTTTETQYGWATSQVPHNLVFGTSETNSLMTRYEKAWQTYFYKETQLHQADSIFRKENNMDHDKLYKPPDGLLQINTNLPEVDLLYDTVVQESGKDRYVQRKISLWDDESLENEEKVEFARLTHSDPDVLINAMRQISRDYFFIVHTLRCKLILTGRSEILNRTNFVQAIDFFPFARPLLHQAEIDMDEKLMSILFDRAIVRLDLAIDEDLGLNNWDEEYIAHLREQAKTYIKPGDPLPVRMKPGVEEEHPKDKDTNAEEEETEERFTKDGHAQQEAQQNGGTEEWDTEERFTNDGHAQQGAYQNSGAVQGETEERFTKDGHAQQGAYQESSAEEEEEVGSKRPSKLDQKARYKENQRLQRGRSGGSEDEDDGRNGQGDTHPEGGRTPPMDDELEVVSKKRYLDNKTPEDGSF